MVIRRGRSISELMPLDLSDLPVTLGYMSSPGQNRVSSKSQEQMRVCSREDPEALSARLVGVDFSSLGDDPVSDMLLFEGAATLEDLDQILREEAESEVEGILEASRDCDAFDLIELLRLREIPVAPVAGLDPDFDGSGAVIDLISLVLLTRDGRNPSSTSREDSQPHEAIPELHARAKRLLRLATFQTKFRNRLRGGALARLAADYQSYFVGVRALQYESVQEAHDRALFDRPEIDQLLSKHFGFTYNGFSKVRDAIQDQYSARLTHLRDVTGDIALRADAEDHQLAPEEIDTFRQAIRDMMFLPAERAAFTSSEIAGHSDLDLAEVEAVLAAFSIDFDGSVDPVDQVLAFLRGRNPLARTCLIRSDTYHIMTSSQIGSDSFRSIAEAALKSDRRGWHRYDRSRMEVSETIAIRSLERLLQTTASHIHLKYFAPPVGADPSVLGADCKNPRDAGELVESDALFVIADLAVCLEVKGRTIADAARRGDLARLETEVKNILGSGAHQARRLEMLISTNGGAWCEDGNWLNLSHVREIRSIVAGLDYFGPLAVALGDLDSEALLGKGALPWITSLHDLEVISRVIDRPSEFLLYLRRRTDAGVAKHFRGVDELDLFMLFMDGGLYAEPDPEATHLEHPRTPPPRPEDRERHRDAARPTFVGTHTDPLDAWMYWVEGHSPFEANKPMFNSHPSALEIVDFLADEWKPGWLRFGADLLGLSGPTQEGLGREIANLVERTRTDGEYHTLTQGYAGPWGYPTFFAAAAPKGWRIKYAAEELRTYMVAKKHQVRSDRSLGLLFEDDGRIVSVIYLNDEPTENTDLDALGEALGLQSA